MHDGMPTHLCQPLPRAGLIVCGKCLPIAVKLLYLESFPAMLKKPLITAIDHLFVEEVEVKPDRPAPGSPSSTLQALDLSQGTCSSFPTQLLLGSIVAESPPCPVQAMPSYMPFPLPLPLVLLTPGPDLSISHPWPKMMVVSTSYRLVL